MNIPKIFLFLCLAGVLASVAGAEQSTPSRSELNSQIDFNHDGVLDYDEVIFALTRRQTKKGDLLAAQKAGRAPKASAVETLDTHVRDLWLDILEKPGPIYGTNPPRFQLDAIDPKRLGLEKLVKPVSPDETTNQKEYLWETNYKVRRSKEDLNKDIKDNYAQGALFSYSQNYERHEDQWSARGIVALEYACTENPFYTAGSDKSDSFFLRSATYRFNIAFDKVNTGGSNRNELDTLDFSGTARYWWHLPDHNPTGLIGLAADVSGHYLTDFNFEKKIYAGTLDLSPYTRLPGHDVYRVTGEYRNRFNEPSFVLKYRWSASLHLEEGVVEEANNMPGLLHYDDFFRLGGKGTLELLPFPNALSNRLSLNISYTHHEAFQNSVPQTHLFSATLQYVFAMGSGLYSKSAKKEGETQSRTERDALWTLRLEYTNGTTPLVSEDDNHLLLGLAVVF